MSYLTLLLVFLCLPGLGVIIKNILSITYLWQIKEYRLDRVMSHLRFKEGGEGGVRLVTYVKIGLLFVSVIYLFSLQSFGLIFTPILVFIVYVTEFDTFMRKLVGGKFQRPRIKSLRNMIIIVLSIITILIPLFWFYLQMNELVTIENLSADPAFPVNYPVSVAFSELIPVVQNEVLIVPLVTLAVVLQMFLLLIIDFSVFLTVALWVFLTGPIAAIKRKLTIYNARNKIKDFSNIKIVGITGSYGKTSTKDFLYQIINKRFKTVKTPKNKNTAVGVAQTILSEVDKETEVLIAEMGAYKRGEIKESTDLVKPDISIVTGIDQQHVSLFGSFENLFETKFEIIEGLKEKGVAILNGNSEYCVRMDQRTKKQIRMYYVVDEDVQKLASGKKDSATNKTDVRKGKNIFADDVKEIKDGLKFSLNSGSEEYAVKINISGKHNISNLLAAIVAANELGMSLKEIAEKINNTKFELAYLTLEKGLLGEKVVNDSYNTNPTGFSAGLNFVRSKSTDGQKWVVTQGIIELGGEKEKVYAGIAGEIAGDIDGIITTDPELADAVKSASEEVRVIVAKSVFGITNLYKANVKEGDLVLLEGSFPLRMITKIIGT